MFRSCRSCGKILVCACAAAVLFCAAQLGAQSEKEFTDSAKIQMKLKKYGEAISILKEAQRKYPDNLEIAELTVQVCEEMESDVQSLARAYEKLIELLQAREAKEERLGSTERNLLKGTQKKLDELMKVRREVDEALKAFVKAGFATCETLREKGKFIEASFVFQRLNALEKGIEGFEKEFTNMTLKLRDKADILKRPRCSSNAQPEKTGKLLADARQSFKKGDLQETRLFCKAVLEIEPFHVDAVALLFDVAQKENDVQEMLRNGLQYLLFPLHDQSSGRAEEIEKAVVRQSDELKKFFEDTENASETLSRIVSKTAHKREFDARHALEQLACITHLTRKIEPVLERAQAALGGVEIFNGKDLSGWTRTENAKVGDGCMEVGGSVGGVRGIICTGVKTTGSFAIQFSFQVEMSGLETRSGAPALISLTLWDDAGINDDDKIFLPIICVSEPREVHLSQKTASGWTIMARAPLDMPAVAQGTWYKMRIEYVEEASRILVFVNGKQAAAINVPANAAPERTGFVGLAQQFFKCVRFKDMYLKP